MRAWPQPPERWSTDAVHVCPRDKFRGKLRVIRVARRDPGSRCGIKSGIDFDSLIVEWAVGCQAKSVGLAQ